VGEVKQSEVAKTVKLAFFVPWQIYLMQVINIIKLVGTSPQMQNGPFRAVQR
jgi:hypothetical protein